MKPFARFTFRPSLVAEKMAINFVRLTGIGKEMDTRMVSETEYHITHESGRVVSRVLNTQETELTVYKSHDNEVSFRTFGHIK